MRFITKVKTDEANCRKGTIDPNEFFELEEMADSNTKWTVYVNSIRHVCTSCPIWQPCLKFAYKHNEQGIWGGMTQKERLSLKTTDPSHIRNRALTALARDGITEAMVREAIADGD